MRDLSNSGRRHFSLVAHMSEKYHWVDDHCPIPTSALFSVENLNSKSCVPVGNFKDHPFILNPTFLYFNDYFLLGCILKMQNHVPPLNLTVSHFHILATVLSHLSHSRYSTFTQRDSLLSRFSFFCALRKFELKKPDCSLDSLSLCALQKFELKKPRRGFFHVPLGHVPVGNFKGHPFFLNPIFLDFKDYFLLECILIMQTQTCLRLALLFLKPICVPPCSCSRTTLHERSFTLFCLSSPDSNVPVSHLSHSRASLFITVLSHFPFLH